MPDCRCYFWISGFLWGGDEIIQGNIGLLDQAFAFFWLFDNIKQFGGNPLQMAMVGHGSGAASICYHAINIRARGKYVKILLDI